MKATVLMTTWQRPEYLYWSLDTILRQDMTCIDYEIVVLNDGIEDETREVVRQFAEKGLPVTHLFTGQRNTRGKVVWRVPGFAFNVGVQRSRSEIVVLTCSDIYHLGDTLRPIIEIVKADPWAIATMHEVYDDFGILLSYLQSGRKPAESEIGVIVGAIKGIPSAARDFAPRACPEMPFLLALRRRRITEIGGYDEDFTGLACEDNDLMDRLVESGCHYVRTHAEVIHLFHGVRTHDAMIATPGYKHNRDLYIARKGQTIRNLRRPWGVLEGDDRDVR